MRILLLLIALFLLPAVSASYISGDITLSSEGTAKFDVETDVAIEIDGLTFSQEQLYGTTEAVMSKEKGVWTFSLDLGQYETILLDVHLPKTTTSVKSLDGVENVLNIEDKVINLIDGDVPLQFSVSYVSEREKSLTWLWGVIILIIVLVALFFFKKKKKHESLHHVLPVMNDPEQRILKELMKGPVRQKALRDKLELPKASFSRYMLHLEQKGLILREGEGRNKLVKLKE